MVAGVFYLPNNEKVVLLVITRLEELLIKAPSRVVTYVMYLVCTFLYFFTPLVRILYLPLTQPNR